LTDNASNLEKDDAMLRSLTEALDKTSNTSKKDDSHLQQIRNALEKSNGIITGIGSRETPEIELQLLTRIAMEAEKRGMRGRSGGAGGADLAFEKGFTDPKNIDVIFPWRGFLPKDMTEQDVTAYLGRERPKQGPGAPVMLEWKMRAKAEELAAKYHPAWEKCSQGARALHSRNMPQVLGLQLDKKTDVVVAWTKDGQATGGTGQAIRIARDLGIPVANLKNPEERRIVLEVLKIADPRQERAMSQAYQAQQGRGY